MDYSSTTKLSVANGPMMIPILDFSNPFWQANGIFVCTNVVGFLISITTGSHLHLDLIGTGAFALATIPTLLQQQQNVALHAQWSSWAVAVWGIKLAGFLFFRATQVRHDKRLEDLLLTTTGTFQFWLVTFVWNVVCSVPYLLGLCNRGTSGILGGGADSMVLKTGVAMYALGLGIETIADLQKFSFKRANPGKFCNAGLWSISQHPNYLGNLILWFGILIMNAPWLIESMSAPPLFTVVPTTDGASITSLLIGSLKSSVNWLWKCRRLIVSLVSPWFMWQLFSSQATGAMTNSLELANSKYGNDPGYKGYVENVPLIFPKF
eukprot:CAMPEP_0113606918 /NCGR_PEP_ID=MMETSP0017_2-20120614/3110_1 /TAXON_ID=2856 /ORGANISM="Cylindrotheca closterium" /LENGTH=321 /DNA_ID=CAMNT_0000515493 /DNA_START=221 /DNA_END=1186 /DNA_ORIENTATION=+ /assembly_acc=CAM_ASM_000147